MKFLKELLAETKKNKSLDADDKQDDDMKGVHTKDRPFMKKPKKVQHPGSNMFFNQTKSGQLAGDVE